MGKEYLSDYEIYDDEPSDELLRKMDNMSLDEQLEFLDSLGVEEQEEIEDLLYYADPDLSDTEVEDDVMLALEEYSLEEILALNDMDPVEALGYLYRDQVLGLPGLDWDEDEEETEDE